MTSNSIYEYYRKVSDKYYIALILPGDKKGQKPHVQYVWEPMARKIVITGFEEYDLFCLGKRGMIEIFEGITGSVILRQESMTTRHLRRCCQKDLEPHLGNVLERMGGKAALNQAIVNFMVDHDQKISMRYKPNNSKL